MNNITITYNGYGNFPSIPMGKVTLYDRTQGKIFFLLDQMLHHPTTAARQDIDGYCIYYLYGEELGTNNPTDKLYIASDDIWRRIVKLKAFI